MKKIGILGWICQLIVILWAIIGGVAEVFKFNVLAKVFEKLHLAGDIYRIVMIVVGVAGGVFAARFSIFVPDLSTALK